MKLGFGLYRHQLDDAHFRFARQCGATHLVIHLVDYFRSARGNQPGDQPLGDDSGWGLAGDPDKLWSFEELSAVQSAAAQHGLQIEAIENFDPAHWHDVLLDGPKKKIAVGKFENDCPHRRARGHPGHRLQFFAGGRGRAREGRVGPWRRGGRGHGRPNGQAHSERHGLEHGL